MMIMNVLIGVVGVCLALVLIIPGPGRRYYVVCRNVSWGPYPLAEARRLAARWDYNALADCGRHRVMGHYRRKLHHWRTRHLDRVAE